MSRTTGCFLVELLAANDIDTVFGIPGVHNLELYRGLANSGVRHVLVRHEQGAGFAADGFARASGRAAAAFTISGPGFTNILTAAAQAFTDSVPLLVVAAAPVRRSLGKQWGVLHELPDQRALAAGIFGVARTASSAEDVLDHLRVCLATLRSGRPRPAYLEVPLDVLAAPTTLAAVRLAAPPPPSAASPESIAAAARALRTAARPLVIAGGGARQAGAQLARLVEALDCPLATTAAGKGLLPDGHPASLGASLPYAPTQRLAAAADVVLAVGTELSETDIYTGLQLPMAGTLIRIDIDPAKLADHYGAAIPLCGDARASLAALLETLADHRAPSARWRGGTAAAAHRESVEAAMGTGTRPARAALTALRAALPADGAVFSDMTQIAYLGNFAFPCHGPGQWFHPSGYGTLGFALPAALGAKLAQPKRAIVALAGDFGVQFTLNELMTAVEAGLSLPLVVWNNGALGQIRDDMQAAQIPLTGVIGRNPDFVALARACGAAALTVYDAAALEGAVRAALVHPGPTLIDVAAAGFGA